MLIGLSVTAQDDFWKEEIDRNNNVAWDIAESNTVKAYQISYQVNTASREKNYSKGIAESNRNLGLIALINGDYESALELSLNALQLFIDDSSKAILQNQIGRIYIGLSDFEKSATALRNAIRINETNSFPSISGNYINYGNLKENIFQFDSAFFYYQLAYAVGKRNSDTIALLSSLNNKGALAGILNQIEKERKNYNEAYLLVPAGSNQKSQIAGNIAVNFLAKNELKKAKTYSDTAYNIAFNNNFTSGKKEARLLQSKIAEREKSFRDALSYYKNYQELSNQLVNESTLKKITQIQLTNDFGQRQKIDSLQKVAEIKTIEDENEKQELIRQEEIQQRNIIIYFVIAFLIGALIISRRLFIISKERKAANKLISKQKVEVEEQRDFAKEQQKITEEQKRLVEEKNHEILESIHYAKRLQDAILPSDALVKSVLPESFIYYQPKDIVAGDFYFVEEIAINKVTTVFFATADCTGHGVPGAMVSVVCANALNRAVKEFKLTDVGQILDKVTDLVIESFEKGEDVIKDGMDIALCALEKQSRTLTYSGANNPLWILSKNETLSTESDYKTLSTEDSAVFLHEIKATKQPVGQFDSRQNFITHQVQLNKGDQVLLSSDGFPDQFGGVKGKKYMSLRFKKHLLSISKLSCSDQKTNLIKEFNHWTKGHEQIDDVCVIGVRL
ncbi:MAG: serine phosphatase RsbU (regulator of sigma subunit)/tetratricopeptide (TPR) repeat protein [Vicingaceae bacterium]